MREGSFRASRAVLGLGGIPDELQIGDQGIEGQISPVSAISERQKQSKCDAATLDALAEDWFP